MKMSVQIDSFQTDILNKGLLNIQQEYYSLNQNIPASAAEIDH
jgi:hypothetical protein